MSGHNDIIVLGHINGLHGVRGWVKIFSDTAPRDNILSYSPWLLRRKDEEWRPVCVTGGRKQGKRLVAQLQGVTDREAAQQLIGAEIAILRHQLASLAADEYYWADLQGLAVETTDGIKLGVIDHMIETGANDVMVVTAQAVETSKELTKAGLKNPQERLIPFIQGQTIVNIDLAAGLVTVNWDPDF